MLHGVASEFMAFMILRRGAPSAVCNAFKKSDVTLPDSDIGPADAIMPDSAFSNVLRSGLQRPLRRSRHLLRALYSNPHVRYTNDTQKGTLGVATWAIRLEHGH